MSHLKNTAQRAVAGVMALGITIVCAGMAALSASERASDTTDKAMLIGLAVSLVAGSHLLPALSRRSWSARVVFAACVLVTVYGHASFFAGVKHRSGEVRAQSVVSTGHTLALQSELAAITARPVAVVAAELAQASARSAHAQAALMRCEATTAQRCTSAQASATSTAAKVDALKTEAVESAHAADLRTQLASAAHALDAARTDASVDPVDAQIAGITGLSVGAVGMLSAVAQSLLLELLGALLWTVALPGAAAVASTQRATVTAPARVATPAAPAAPIAVSVPKNAGQLPGAAMRWSGSICRMIEAVHRLKVNAACHLSSLERYLKAPASASPATALHSQ